MKELTAEVIEKKQLTHDTILLSVKVPPEFTFTAGQYVFFRINNGTETKLRAYSILSPPSKKGQLDFVIKLISGGFASEEFRKFQIGTKFPLSEPLGHFVFDERLDEHWFICNGTGIAPLHSMLKEHFNPNKKFTLLFGVKYKRDLLFYEELKKLSEENENFTFIPTLTREEWEGKTGRVYLHLPQNIMNKTFYICGLKELVLDTKEKLLEKGVRKENIRFERYS